jgi:periplasmic copper chaperone A
MTKLTVFAVAALALCGFAAAQAQEFRQGDLTIFHPWTRPTAESQKNGAAYFSIKNSGSEADKLVSAESPAAEKTELHEMVNEGGVMKMLPLPGGIEIQPGPAVEFKPGGYHVMLIGLKQRLAEGQTIPLTLTFAKAGSVAIEAKVEKSSSGMNGMHQH